MIPDPTTAARRKAVPVASVRLRLRSVTFSSSLCRAAGVEFADLFVNGINLPAASHRIGGPDLRLIGVAARRFALDLRSEPGRFEPLDRVLYFAGGCYEDSVVVPADRRRRIDRVQCQLQSRPIGDEERVVGKELYGSGIEQRRVEVDAPR